MTFVYLIEFASFWLFISLYETLHCTSKPLAWTKTPQNKVSSYCIRLLFHFSLLNAQTRSVMGQFFVFRHWFKDLISQRNRLYKPGILQWQKEITTLSVIVLKAGILFFNRALGNAKIVISWTLRAHYYSQASAGNKVRNKCLNADF